ncbi:N-acetylmuramoyl-L-alanine amidase family protein [Arundinibacter roseus]|uniref:N-acetylmuramoyl-L-alanine amidase n=1 Tax=Arundinibacter roseus TaxID=2070510 RepID=A0A4R4K7X1_9BACT|nr:N-acetylmuramoyl-L-alanine amidase [Arundinibacter roseus]TDB63630.1 N-acetylmuramoyl-L-alanine amidase [Arundinibacter roseus]
MLKVLKIVGAAGCLVLSLAFAFRNEPPLENDPNKVDVVVIDAGHGGHDSGTRGRVARESRTTLKIALALGKKIKEEMPDVRVLYTRTSDVFVELDERSAFANRNKADLFISIHCNSSPGSSKALGTETYVMGLHKTEGNLEVAKRENSVILKEKDYQEKYKGFDPTSPLAHIMLANYQSAFLSSSLRFADHVERQFKSISQRRSRGVKQAGFIVLWRTTMPSVLVETGFLSNPTEEGYLNSTKGQDEVAEAVFGAFKQYRREMER